MISSLRDRALRARRPSKQPVDPWRPLQIGFDDERTRVGALASTMTVFLAGAECPFTCVFCDLWRHTLDGATPRGGIVRQLSAALAAMPAGRASPTQIKLYNASNFFDSRAVPPAEDPELAELLAPFAQVTVECHPSLVGRRCAAFAARLRGRLQVAMGLETAHPQALARLNKGMTLDDFERAAEFVRAAGIGLRAFVLVGAPFVPAGEALDWAVRSVERALACGAEVVSLIPVRGGNGELERLAAAGDFTTPSLSDLEVAHARSVRLGRGVVLADLWDLHLFANCASCFDDRAARLQRVNLSGLLEPAITCVDCGAGPL